MNEKENISTIIPMAGMRKLIAERMKLSLNVHAQLTHTVKVDMSAVTKIRNIYKNEGKRLSFNDFVLMATTKALLDFPMMNSEITEEGIVVKKYVNLGIAVALDEGLIVPNVKNAQKMGLEELSSTVADVTFRAREGKLKAAEYRDGTFTVSNLGMMGVFNFTAIINTPESGILAVGEITDTPVAANGAVEIHPIMMMTLTYDHRVTDGAPAAQFLSQIKEYLETPGLMLEA